MESLEDVPSFDFVIPLRPFERCLLEGIQRTYSQVLDKDLQCLDNSITGIIQQSSDSEDHDEDDDAMAEILGDTSGGLEDVLFRGWSEYRAIQSRFTKVNGEKILRDPTGAFTRADIDAIRELERSGNTGIHHIFGQKMLYEYNTSFFDHFVAEPLPRINFIPAASDGSHWDTLAGMAMAEHYTYLADVIRDSDACFDIWKVVHQFTLAHRRPHNSQNVHQQFMLSPAFEKQFVLEPASDEQDTDGENILILDRHSISVLEEAENDLEANFLDDEFTSAWESQQLSDDPRSYIETVPWDELELTTAENLEKGGVDSFLPYFSRDSEDDLAAMTKWMLWKSPSSNFFDSHALHVDDEVYQYCVINGWHFPGHLLDNHTVLAVSPLEATEFVANLRHYWDYWNDCTLSVDPSDNQLYLLETIPGRQYRMRQKFQDFTSASRYFCNLVEQHAHPTDSDAKIRAIMGSDYRPRYQSMLRHIPPDQFLHVDTEVLGEGQNGAVYGAIWKPPEPFLCSVQAETQCAGTGLPVVFKKVKPKAGNSGHITKFLCELDMTFTALGGCSIGCVKFLGITSFPMNEFESVAPSSHLSNYEDELFLVFERASEGSLPDFMERELQGTTGTKSWIIVLETLSSIARGLANIHDHGIIHGDLHPNNILVTKIFYPDGPAEDSMTYDVLLSDLGEGKCLGDGDQHLMSTIGNLACAFGKFMPKEVGEEGGWSAKADVFCFGRITEFMLRIRVIICTTKGSEDERAIPTKLKSMLEKCLAKQPAERPQMSPLGQQLDDLCLQVEDDEAEWTTIDTLNNPAAGRYSSPLISELGFSCPISLDK